MYSGGQEEQTPQAILRRIDVELAEMRKRTFDGFVRPDYRGAKHNLSYISKTNISVINSAALVELIDEDESFVSPALRPVIMQWKEEILLPSARGAAAGLKASRTETRHNAAYHIGQLQRALEDLGLQRQMRTWLSASIKEWSARRKHIAPSVFLAHLANPPKRGALAQQCLALSEYVISRQVAAALSDDWADFNAIDLALAVALVHPSSISPTLLSSAITILNRFAEKEQIWKNHPSGTVSGSSKGCSSLYACNQLMHHGEKSVVSRLEPALLSHLRWVRSSRIEDCWRGSDLPERSPEPETWFNCLCAQFLLGMRSLISQRLQQELKYTYRERASDGFRSLKELVLDRRVATAINQSFVVPVNKGAKREHFSAILFGPPGTAKTTIAEAIAHDVGWPLIELGVADFLSRGLEGVFSRATEVFEDLLQLSSVVILLDEVEQVFRNRTDEADLRQKFLTSALLPPLKRLRDKETVILLIATNFIRDFDEAAKRIGRIDLILPVGAPNHGQKVKLVSSILKYNERRAKALANYLPDGISIGDIQSIKKVAKHNELAPGMLFREWKKVFPSGPSISQQQLRDFDDDAKRYSRFR